MISFLEGKIEDINPTDVVISTGGVGYFVSISLKSYEEIKNEKEVRLFTHLQIRDDAHVLFGFYTKIERKIFQRLISVSGVGPSTALIVLSTLTVGQLYTAIVNGDAHTIQKVKGIGLKTAQRITIDLKDKLQKDEIPLQTEGKTSDASIHHQEIDKAVVALVTLGYNKTLARKNVDKVLQRYPNAQLSLEEIIREALKMA